MNALPVRIGTGTLPHPMTPKQAQRYGDKHMPDDLRRAGFRTTVFKATPELHGGTWLRINYGK